MQEVHGVPGVRELQGNELLFPVTHGVAGWGVGPDPNYGGDYRRHFHFWGHFPNIPVALNVPDEVLGSWGSWSKPCGAVNQPPLPVKWEGWRVLKILEILKFREILKIRFK